MNCHDAREWLSDLLDDALATEARARVDAHLARVRRLPARARSPRATVSLLHAVERPQAPAGFVDRVLEAARPAPWYRRALDWLSAVRLLRFPVEAAAVVLVASLAVYVFQGTPELRQAARPESPQGHAGDSVLSSQAEKAIPDVGSDNAGRAHTKPSAKVPSGSLRLPRSGSARGPTRVVSGGTQGGPRAGTDEGAVDLGGAHGRARLFPARVERLHAPPTCTVSARRVGCASRCRADPRRRAQPS